jgi:hypothetical protein
MKKLNTEAKDHSAERLARLIRDGIVRPSRGGVLPKAFFTDRLPRVKGMHPRSLQSLRNGVKVAETLKPLVGTDGLLATIVGLKWAAVGNRRAPV